VTAALVRSRISFAVSLLAFSLAADAEIFRCVAPDGEVSFADHPCPAGAQQRIEAVQYNRGWNSAAVMDANRALLDSYNARIDRQRARRAAAATAPPQESPPDIPDEPSPPVDTQDESCPDPPQTDAPDCGPDCGHWQRPPPGVSTYGPPSRFPRSPRAPMNLR
jgi:hypothetical protein